MVAIDLRTQKVSSTHGNIQELVGTGSLGAILLTHLF